MKKGSKTRNRQTSHSTMGSIRIIAGKHRGRKLPVLSSEGLRPTTDRVKETLFNWLMPYIHDAKCLDCFAGAGSLGFEAYSRGAAKVTMLEKDKAACHQLKTNTKLLDSDKCDIHCTDSLQFLASQPATVQDIVFIDPPFNLGFVEKVVPLIAQGWVATDSLVYIETEQQFSTAVIPPHWHLLKEKKAGQVCYRLYQVSELKM